MAFSEAMIAEGAREMFQIRQDESIAGTCQPNRSLHRDGGISPCGRAAYRVVSLRSVPGERQIGLCGLHFFAACRSYPGLLVWENASESVSW